MKKRVVSLALLFILMQLCILPVCAEESSVVDSSLTVVDTLDQRVTDESVQNDNENNVNSPFKSDSFTLIVDVLSPDGPILSSTMSFSLYTENGEWLYNRHIKVDKIGRYEFVFPVVEYEIGKKFKIIPTNGVNYINYCDVDLPCGTQFTVETYAYVNSEGELILSDSAHITACPLSLYDPWEKKAESYVTENGIESETPYLIWVSKRNYTVSVFLKENGKWNFIKQFACSIGAEKTPTVTGVFTYHQYQTKWQYDGYYVGPIMRFYEGYAIHSTLIRDNGTDYDGRVGKMISHGCVRVRPESMKWLTDYVPLNTTVYVTND